MPKIWGLRVIGDSDLVVMQVKGQFVVKNDRLKLYKPEVWDLMDFFDAFAIDVVRREKNLHADALAIAASNLLPCDELTSIEGRMKIIFRPFVLDNYEHWQFFHDDAQVIRFLNNL